MSKKELYEGPDISYHNGTVNIKQIRDACYKRVGIRAGYGKNNVDQKYINNAKACFNLLVNVMIYWFSYAYTVEMAIKEAEYCIAQAAKFWKKCPIAFDFEYDSVRYARTKGINITKQMATDMAIAFLKTVKASGYIPVIYTNRDYLRNYFDMDRILKEVGTVYVWYARYCSTLPASEVDIPDVWQYSSKERIPGVSGNVDMNKFYTDFESVKAEDVNPVCNINILNFQKAANADGYLDQNGNLLVEDGIDGAKTQYVRMQIALKAKWTVLGYKVGSTGHVVEWYQERCNEILGHAQEEDGKYGKTARKETLYLQEKLNLEKDGVAGYNTIQAVFYN